MGKLGKFWRGGTANRMIVIGAVLLLATIVAGYSQSWYFSWVGVSDYVKPVGVEERGKTLWDWLDLLIVPVVLAIAAFYLNRAERVAERKIADERAKVEREIADERARVEREIADKQAEVEREAKADHARETALQTYLDRMTELLLEKNLRESQEEDEVRVVARARTLTTLRELDGGRRGTLLKFLYEAKLINRGKCVIKLEDANLSEASLSETYLGQADLSWIDLSYADLREAILKETNLTEASLSQANLSSANLSRAILNKANLRGANLSTANLGGVDLSEAKSDKNTKWPNDFDPKQAGVIFVDEEDE